jgi:hypothetical protein
MAEHQVVSGYCYPSPQPLTRPRVAHISGNSGGIHTPDGTFRGGALRRHPSRPQIEDSQKASSCRARTK